MGDYHRFASAHDDGLNIFLIFVVDIVVLLWFEGYGVVPLLSLAPSLASRVVWKGFQIKGEENQWEQESTRRFLERYFGQVHHTKHVASIGSP